MPNEIKNEASFERALDNLAQGFGHIEKLGANKAGAKVFMETMKPKVPVSATMRRSEHTHLRDSLIEVEKPNGAVEIGFTSKGEKGYIGRFINDGWESKDRNGQTHSSVPGKHFWESTQRETKGLVAKAVTETLKQDMNRKVRGG